MNFSNVKAITIPEGTVKSISINNTVVWQEPVASTTYRKLQYIHFSGSEYIRTVYPAWETRVNIVGQFTPGSTFSIKKYLAAFADSSKQLAIRTGTGNKQAGWVIGSNNYYSNNLASNLNTYSNLRLEIELWNGPGSNNNTYYNIWDSNDNRLYAGGPATFAEKLPFVSLFDNVLQDSEWVVGGQRGSNDASLVQGSTMNLTEFYILQTGTNNDLYRMQPCQRKSDSVCGLYDIVNDIFYPMEGTNITTSAAGPTVVEDWK